MLSRLLKFLQLFFVLFSLILFAGCGIGSPTALSVIPDTLLPIPGIERSQSGNPVECSTCCRRCVTGKACGNSCINVNLECHQPPGCACNRIEDMCYLPTPAPTPTPSPTPTLCDVEPSDPIASGECSSDSPERMSRMFGQDRGTINSSKLKIKFSDNGFNRDTGLPVIDGDQIKVTIKPGSLPEEVPDPGLNVLTLSGPYPLGNEFTIPLKAVKNVVTITSVSSGTFPYNSVKYSIDQNQVVDGEASRGVNLITAPSTGVGINSISFEVIVKPDINEQHIFEGEIITDTKGVRKAVGFHSRPGGVDSSTARIARKSDGIPMFYNPPDSMGVYQAVIEVKDTASGDWIKKNKFSTFFPDIWDRNTVIENILDAFFKLDILPQTEDTLPVVTSTGIINIKYSKSTNKIITSYPDYQPST